MTLSLWPFLHAFYFHWHAILEPTGWIAPKNHSCPYKAWLYHNQCRSYAYKPDLKNVDRVKPQSPCWGSQAGNFQANGSTYHPNGLWAHPITNWLAFQTKLVRVTL